MNGRRAVSRSDPAQVAAATEGGPGGDVLPRDLRAVGTPERGRPIPETLSKFITCHADLVLDITPLP